ncbi:hypothetical protein SDC9_209758 [bioreactor metagenome]|uniref:Uncharacterized protein n=1 Tax=bioreactor metagenome TaxID=1076179 RepID=A0A645JFP0_9ZZZZ
MPTQLGQAFLQLRRACRIAGGQAQADLPRALQRDTGVNLTENGECQFQAGLPAFAFLVAAAAAFRIFSDFPPQVLPRPDLALPGVILVGQAVELLLDERCDVTRNACRASRRAWC